MKEMEWKIVLPGIIYIYFDNFQFLFSLVDRFGLFFPACIELGNGRTIESIENGGKLVHETRVFVARLDLLFCPRALLFFPIYSSVANVRWAGIRITEVTSKVTFMNQFDDLSCSKRNNNNVANNYSVKSLFK